MADLDPKSGPWLIRSHYWSRWHRRGADGGAQGYTDDIAEAGVFDYEVARHYNDWGDVKSGRDEAVPTSRAHDDLKARLEQLTSERDTFAARVEQIAARLKSQAPRP